MTIKKLAAKLILKKSHLTMKKKQKISFPSVTYSAGDKIKGYKSSNKKLASVNKKGVITANKKGTVKIFIIMNSGIKKYCIIKIK